MKQLLAASLILIAPCSVSFAAEQRPNIILIMVDDMGYSDLGCYGGEIDTPNIDALAAGGLRFTQFYNSARCCPTRASLMTGLHPHQVGIGHMTAEAGPGAAGKPAAYAGNINDSCVTLAQVAKGAGYATFMTGKWHLSGSDRADWPLQRGFDRYYGCLAGAIHHFQPYGERMIFDGNDMVTDPKSTSDRPFYSTDAFTDHAIRFIDEHEWGEGKDQPCFLYLAYTAPHWPLHAHDQELEKYRGKYALGWDKLREQRYRKQVSSGLIPASWKMSPRDPQVPAWDTLDAVKQAESGIRMSAYAAMIDRIDQKIGDLVTTLKKHNAYENTLILFLADNGACAEMSITGLGDPIKDRAPRTELVRPSYGRAWANASATPYRLYKHYTHEGGANTPFIAHWPARIKGGHDWLRAPAQIIDVMPSVVELTGATYPATFHNSPVTPIDGVSLVPAFEGKPLARKAPIFIEHENNASVRDGEWKLVGRDVSPPTGMVPAKWELYHITEDGTELDNLASADPERVKAMSDQWQEWAGRAGVYPKARGVRACGPRAAHKGANGHVLVVGGDHGMNGALRLAGEAALRVGAGLVSLATRAGHAAAISAACPELMSHGVDSARDLSPLLARATVVAVGPGLGRSRWAQGLLAAVFESTLPLVVDADALNLLSREPLRRDNWVLTPHPGEAGRLLNQETARVQENRYAAVRALAETYGGVAVLKGAGTLVYRAGAPVDVCAAGNPGMAAGGMGDVLSGVIAGLIAQGLEPPQAAMAGVCLHARAGDRAAASGERGMTARDVIGELRAVMNAGA